MTKLLTYRLPRILLLFIVAMTLATSCSDEPRQDTFVYTDVVLYESCDADGSTFGLGDRHLIAPGVQLPEETVAVGNSLMLRYTVADAATDRINVLGYAAINNIRMTDGDITAMPDWASQPVGLQSLWMNCSRVIIRALLPYDSTPRRLEILSTVSDGNATHADLYLIHQRPAVAPTFDRLYYMSFDTTPLRAKGISTITVHISDAVTATARTFDLTLTQEDGISDRL